MSLPSVSPEAAPYQEANVVSLRRKPSGAAVERSRSRTDDHGAPVRRIFAGLVRRWFIILPVAVGVFLAFFTAALVFPPNFQATALVMVSPAHQQVLAEGQMIDGKEPPGASEIESEIEVLQSPTLLRRLVTTLSLDRDPEWNPALRSQNPLEWTLSAIDRIAAGMHGRRSGEPTAEEGINRVALEVGKALSVSQRGESYGIDVTMESEDPAKAALMANTLVELYLQTQTEGRFDTAQRAGGWLSQRLDQLRQEVLTKERTADAFRVRHGLSVASGGEPQAQSTEIQGMLVSARADLAEKMARLRQVESLRRDGRSAESMADAIGSAAVSQLRAQAAEVARRLAELRQRYSDEHPAVQAAVIEQQNVREQIEEEVGRIVASLRNEVQVAQARFDTLQSSYGTSGEVRGENTDAVIQYRELLRQAAAARQVHESFLQRFHELANQGALPIANSRLVSNATPPEVPKGTIGMALLNSLLLGIFVGLAVGLLLDLLDQSIGDADDAERKLGIPALVSVPMLRPADFKRIPKFRQNPIDYLADKPMSGFAESLRVLRAAVMHASPDKKVRVLAITSAVPQEGKTTVSVCLARVAAMSGQRVLLVDCDLRHPAVSQLLGFNSDSGLFEVLNGAVDWRQAIRPDPETHARVLPTVASQFSPKDVFSSPPMARLVDELRNECDLVILDCPPVLAVAETRMLVGHADAVIMVARGGRTPAGAVSSAIREIESTGADILGLALNCVDFRVPGQSGYGMYFNTAASKYYRS